MAHRDNIVHVLTLVLAAVLLIAGWQYFWFLCDDAYIAFRYAHNHLHGRGWTWNPEPFLPVEGYTSWLWVVLLEGLWRLTGRPPPETANTVLLLAGIGSLALVADLARRLPLSERWQSLRPCIIGLVLVGTVTNRTFLTWTSSGLEQGLATFWTLGWLWTAAHLRPGRRRDGLLCALAAALALTRPDGLLYAASSAIIVGWRLRKLPARHAADIAPLLPLLAPAVHVLWRLQVYGFPLPTTYYAKHTASWPSMGLAYAASFLLEYAYWPWLLAAIGLVIRWGRAGFPRLDPDDVPAWMAVATIAGHVAYYTLRVGGDHFEYRPYHHLVPLVMLAAPWLLDRLALSPRAGLATMAGSLLLGLVLPWTHAALTRSLEVYNTSGILHVRVAPHLPPPLSWYARSFDALQGQLIHHFVGTRHATHKLYLRHQQTKYPASRQETRILWNSEDIPVLATGNTGWPGWVAPDVAIVDMLGLNDVVIAHTATREHQHRRYMAHERRPPEGYVACFRPNVRPKDGRLDVRVRKRPLTEDNVRACEQTFRARVFAR